MSSSIETRPAQMDVSIRPYTVQDAPGVLSLLSLCLGEKPFLKRDMAWWEWRHCQNPFGPSIMLVAEADNQVVGIRTFMRWELACDGARISAVKAVDTATHPNYQRRGIFSKLTQAACNQAQQEGVQLIFNTPNRNSLPGYLKLGWQSIGDIAVSFRILRPLRLATKLIRRAILPPNQPHQNTTQSFFRSEATLASAFLQETDEFRSLLARVASPPGKLATPRDLPFYQWRYCHPHIPYFAEVFRKHDKLAGVLFYRLNHRKGAQEILVDDWVSDSAEYADFSSTLNNLIQRTQVEYILRMPLQELGVAKPPNRDTFQRNPFHLVMRWLQPTDSKIGATRSSWFLTLGDLEAL